jgi:Tol biopolymer transport system component
MTLTSGSALRWRMAAGQRPPENFTAINSDSNEYYISFTVTGDIYFGSSRPGGFGQEDIYVSRLENGRYGSPVNLGEAVNSDKAEFDPFISPDENLLIFASSKRDDTVGGTDLYYSKFEKGQWTAAANLGNRINTPTRDFCPYISPDGKYFFFSSEANVKWVEIQSLGL